MSNSGKPLQNSSEPEPNIELPALNTTYLVYVDDSGDERHDLLTAVLIPVGVWTTLLDLWKKYRSWIEGKFGLPPTKELHAVELAKDAKPRDYDAFLGRLQRGDRQSIAETAFKTIGNQKLSNIRCVTTYQNVPQGSGDLYASLIELIEEFLGWTSSFGVVWYDGTAQSLENRTRAVHRSLSIDSRRVLEDPTGYDSTGSHLIQIADLVAYAAFWAIKQDHGAQSSNFLRSRAYGRLIENGLVWPCNLDEAGQPAFAHRLGISGYP